MKESRSRAGGKKFLLNNKPEAPLSYNNCSNGNVSESNQKHFSYQNIGEKQNERKKSFEFDKSANLKNPNDEFWSIRNLNFSSSLSNVNPYNKNYSRYNQNFSNKNGQSNKESSKVATEWNRRLPPSSSRSNEKSYDDFN